MLRYVLIIVLSFLLVGCGGGVTGDSSTPTGNMVAISPDTASIDVGQSLSIRITGGVGPYRLVSSDPQALPVTNVINNLNAADLMVTAGDASATEIVTITVTDSKGQSAKAAVTVRSVTLTLSPSALSLASTKTQTFNLVGGHAPFTVTTTRPDLLVLDTSGLSGKVFSVFANHVTTQVDGIGLSVMDAAGNSVSAKISVIPSQVFSSLQVEPSGSGGVAGMVSAIAAGQHGMLRIKTGDGYSVPRTLIIQQMSGSFTLDNADVTGRLMVDVGSDHMALAPLTVSTSAVTQTGKLRVTDIATGEFVESGFQIAGLNLSAAPSTVTAVSDTNTCRSGSAGMIQIMGGVPPYVILSASPTLVTANPSTVTQSGGSTTLTGYGICTSASGVILTVTDAAGVKISVPYTSVPLPSAALNVLPAALAAAPANVLTLTITGGTPPYSATSANAAIATVNSVTGNLVTVTANAIGSTGIVVRDASSLTASTALTVN